jgi:hypothetical protein
MAEEHLERVEIESIIYVFSDPRNALWQRLQREPCHTSSSGLVHLDPLSCLSGSGECVAPLVALM